MTVVLWTVCRTGEEVQPGDAEILRAVPVQLRRCLPQLHHPGISQNIQSQSVSGTLGLHANIPVLQTLSVCVCVCMCVCVCART